jgi:hypothetical protein
MAWGNAPKVFSEIRILAGDLHVLEELRALKTEIVSLDALSPVGNIKRINRWQKAKGMRAIAEREKLLAELEDAAKKKFEALRTDPTFREGQNPWGGSKSPIDEAKHLRDDTLKAIDVVKSEIKAAEEELKSRQLHRLIGQGGNVVGFLRGIFTFPMDSAHWFATFIPNKKVGIVVGTVLTAGIGTAEYLGGSAVTPYVPLAEEYVRVNGVHPISATKSIWKSIPKSVSGLSEGLSKGIRSPAAYQTEIKQHAEEQALKEYREHKMYLGQRHEAAKTSIAYYAADKKGRAQIVNGEVTPYDVLDFLNQHQHETYTSASLAALPSETQITPFFFHNETRDVATVDAPGKGKCVIASLEGAIILIPLESYKAADLPMHEGEAPKAGLGPRPPNPGDRQDPPAPPPQVAANDQGPASGTSPQQPPQNVAARVHIDQASAFNKTGALMPEADKSSHGMAALAGMAFAIPAERLIRRAMNTKFLAGAAERFMAPVSKPVVSTLERLAGPAVASRVMKAAHLGGAELDPLIGVGVFLATMWAGSKASDALHKAGESSDTLAIVEGVKKGDKRSIAAGSGSLIGTTLAGVAAGFVCSLPAEGLSPWVGVPVQLIAMATGAFLGKEGVTMAYDKVAGYLKTHKPQIGIVNIMPKFDNPMRPSGFGFGPQGMTPAYNT